MIPNAEQRVQLYNFNPPRPKLKKQVVSRLTSFVTPAEAWTYTDPWSDYDYAMFSSCERRSAGYVNAVSETHVASRPGIHRYTMAIGLSEKYNTGHSQKLFQRFKHFTPWTLRSSSSPAHTVDFVRAIQLADHFNDQDFSSAIQDIWLEKVKTGKLPFDPALVVADQYQLPNLLAGLLYYKLLRLGRNAQNCCRPAPLDSDSKMTQGHRLRIYQAYIHLSQRSHTLLQPERALAFNPPETCESHSTCLATWAHCWRSGLKQIAIRLTNRPADLEGNLKALRGHMQKCQMFQDKRHFCLSCKGAASRSIELELERIQRNLPHIFDL